MGHIRDQETEKCMQPLNFGRQQRFFYAGAVQQIVHGLICLADLHDVDAVLRSRRYGDKLTADVGTGPVKLVALQGSHDKYLYAFAPHTQGHELHRKGLAGSAGPKNGDIGILVDAGIENVHNDERIVVLVDAEKNAIVITHLIACKWIAAGRAGGKDIALRPLVELAFQRDQGQRGQKSLLLTKGTGLNIHVLRKQELFHFRDLPFKVIHTVGCDSDEQV